MLQRHSNAANYLNEFFTCLKFTGWSVRILFSRYWNKASDRFTKMVRSSSKVNVFEIIIKTVPTNIVSNFCYAAYSTEL